MTAETLSTSTAETLERLEFTIGGMTCAACANTVQRKLNRLDGVTATVNFATERAQVSGLAPDRVDEAIAAVTRAGYSAALREDDSDEWSMRARAEHISSLRRRLIVAAVLTVPLCDLTILLALVPGLRFPFWQLVCLLLAVPIVTWAALPFHRTTVRNLRYRTISMDTLVSLGILASFGWALFSLIFGSSSGPGYWLGFGVTPAGADSIYLDVAAGMTTFQLAGRYFEARSRRSAGDVLNALKALATTEVRLLRDEVEIVEPIESLTIGDRFVVRPGETVPADGIIESGFTAIDTSMITGEPIPADAETGTEVVGGTISTNGRIVVRATAVGANTKLAQMAAIADEAQQRKAKVQSLVDRVVTFFVPAVLVLSVLTFVGWMLAGDMPRSAFGNAVAVLIIACPCALGLATPTALMVGVGRGAQLGILIKGHDALEASGVIDTVVLDKTGTLTTGEMIVTEIVPIGVSRKELLRLAGALESGSEHGIGSAVATLARSELHTLPSIEGFRSLPGLGATATLDGAVLLAGNRRLLDSEFIDVPEEAATQAANLAGAGNTVVFMTIDGRVIGVIAVSDANRPLAVDTVRRLKEMKLRTIMLTGDSAEAASRVADALGIDEVIPRVLPGEKADAVRLLQLAGRRVAVVGDGVNDAAALATANLGMAMVTGTDIAMKSADIILVRDDLGAVVDAIQLSRKTLRTIHGNLVWAFGYNVLAIPIAAAGFLNPLVAAAAMAVSSVLVVGNSLRLRSFERS
jgi:Cu+-exporting ATPase